MSDDRSIRRSRRGVLAVLACAAALGPTAVPGVAQAPAPAADLVPLHATATQPFVTPDGRPVHLIGLNVIPVFKGSPGDTWPQERYDQIRAKGFNAVRFVVYWDLMEPRRGTFDATSFATLDTAIARARAARLRVVLDIIHLWGPGGFEDVPRWARSGDSVSTVKANGAPYVRLVAARYRDDPTVVAYDLVNEFHRFPIDQNAVLRVYDKLIAMARQVAPAKIVMIEPTYGDTSIEGALVDFTANLHHRRNVVWSLHDYFAGADDDGYRPDGSHAGRYVFGGRTGYRKRDPAALRAHLLVQLDRLRQERIPLWISEFGIGEGVRGRDRWIADQVALFRRYGLGYAWWEYHTSGALSATTPSYAWHPWIDLLFR